MMEMTEERSIKLTVGQFAWFKRKSEVAFLRFMCVSLGLENADILDKYTDAELADSFNGIGPDFFPEWMVSAMNRLSPELLPACMIHDVEWMESDGTMESFHESNGRLRRNGKIIASSLYGFWHPKRYIVKWKARAFSKACESFGCGIWQDYAKAREGDCETMFLKPPCMSAISGIPTLSYEMHASHSRSLNQSD